MKNGASDGQAPQRIGLSATQRPLDRIAKFLVGPHRECRIVDAGRTKELDLQIVVPMEDMTDPTIRTAAWPRRATRARGSIGRATRPASRGGGTDPRRTRRRSA